MAVAFSSSGDWLPLSVALETAPFVDDVFGMRLTFCSNSAGFTEQKWPVCIREEGGGDVHTVGVCDKILP